MPPKKDRPDTRWRPTESHVQEPMQGRALIHNGIAGAPDGPQEGHSTGGVRWKATNLPKVEVAERYTGIPGVGPSLKNYLMELETVEYCWERDGYDPAEFFRKMVGTLAGEAETFYRLTRDEVLEELAEGEIVNPTARFLQLLLKEFAGQTEARVEEFRDFRRKKEESLLANYCRLRELAEDLESTDERLLVRKFVQGLDEELKGVVRSTVYSIGADVTLKEVYLLTKKTEQAQRLLDLEDSEGKSRAKMSWAATAVPDPASGGSSRAKTRLCHTCGEHGHLKRDCPNVPTCEQCGKGGHQKEDCYSRPRDALGTTREELQAEVRRLQRRLEQLPNPTEVKARALLAYEEVDEAEEEGEGDYTREYAAMAYPRAREDIRLRPRAKQSQSSEASSGTRPRSSQAEGAWPSEMRRHPNERLVCQASVLIAEKGSLTVGGLLVKQAIIDTGAHPVLIGKGLANQLKLDCGVSESEDYDVLVGMELLYRIRATICTWQEKVLFRMQYWDLESSVGTLPVRFVRQEPREAYQAQRKDLTEELEDWPWERYEEEYERRIERRTFGQGPPDLKERVSRVQALDVPICILELYEGIGIGLAAALRAGYLAEDKREPVKRAFEEIVGVLGRGVPADAAQLGSRAHRPRRYWQNVMSTAALRHSLALMQRLEPRLVSDILEPNRLPAPVTCTDHPSQYQCNEPGKPRQALPTLVSYADARGFRMEGELPGPGMIYDVRKGVWEQPTANEREAAMGHLWGATAHPEVTEQQRRATLGRAMDANVMTWLLDTMRMHLKAKELKREIACCERYRDLESVEWQKKSLARIEERYDLKIDEGWVAYMAMGVAEGVIERDGEATVETPEKAAALQKVLKQHRGTFAYTLQELGRCTTHEMKIELTTEVPIYQRKRRMSPGDLDNCTEKCHELLEAGLIQRSESDYAAATVVASRKDPTGAVSARRMCGDYRSLNKVTVVDRYPMQSAEEIFDKLQGAKVFSTLDLRQGFNQIPIRPADRKKTHSMG
ncbi:unnamed protein product [Closterium sp. NIES-54]